MKDELAIAIVIAELGRAERKFKPFNSPHEGFAVILEEVDELWDEVKGNRGKYLSGATEAMQVAAMGLRYLLNLAPDEAGAYLLRTLRRQKNSSRSSTTSTNGSSKTTRATRLKRTSKGRATRR